MVKINDLEEGKTYRSDKHDRQFLDELRNQGMASKELGNMSRVIYGVDRTIFVIHYNGQSFDQYGDIYSSVTVEKILHDPQWEYSDGREGGMNAHDIIYYSTEYGSLMVEEFEIRGDSIHMTLFHDGPPGGPFEGVLSR